MGAVFEPFLNNGFNFAILKPDGNIEYFIENLQIWEMRLVKTVALSFKNLADRLSKDTALFSYKSWRSFNRVSLDTKLNLNLELGPLELFRSLTELNVN